MRRIAVFCLLTACVIAVLVRCTSPTVAGGTGSEDVNCRVSITALLPDSTPAAHAVVRLRPAEYLAGTTGTGLARQPARTGDLTTDDNGAVLLDGIDTGAFCIEILDTAYTDGPVAALIRLDLHRPDTSAACEGVALARCASLAGYVDRSVVGSGADVVVRVRGLERLTNASSGGSYALANIPAGGMVRIHYAVETSEYLGVEVGVTPAAGADLRLPTVLPGSSFIPDLVAVRAILDSNGLDTLPAGSVATVIDGRVDALHIDSMGITVVPSVIGALDHLRAFSVAGNRLTALPLALGECDSLRELAAQLNALTSLPAALFDLPALEMVTVAANVIDSLPANVGACTTISKISIADNRIRDLPASICALTKMREFFVEKNLLDSIPACIGGFKALISCNLNQNNLTFLPDSIMTIPFLSHLDVDSNRLCTVDSVMGAWIDGFNPGWDSTQACP